jgi:hypothetical protein
MATTAYISGGTLKKIKMSAPIPKSWIEETKKMVQVNKKVEIVNRHKLALRLLEAVEKWSFKEVKVVCVGNRITTQPEFSTMIGIAETWSVLPKGVLGNRHMSWAHLVVCSKSPDLLEKAIKEKWTSTKTRTEKCKYKNSNTRVKKINPKSLKERLEVVLRHMNTLTTCPSFLRETVNSLAAKCIMVASLPTK